jgi:hypothetical protein
MPRFTSDHLSYAASKKGCMGRAPDVLDVVSPVLVG